MERRIAALGVVVLLLGAVVAVQLLDPQFGEEDPPEVDFSEPPNEIAADAAKQFEYVDYAYQIDIADESGEWEQVRVMHVEHSDREYYKVGPLGERGVVVYGTDAITFVRPGANSKWRVTASPETAYPAFAISQPLSTERIRGSTVSINSNNGSYLIISVSSNPLKIIEEHPGNAKIIINKETGLVERVLVEYHPEPSQNRYIRLKRLETEASIHRPKDIPFSPKEVLLDVLRGPLYRL